MKISRKIRSKAVNVYCFKKKEKKKSEVSQVQGNGLASGSLLLVSVLINLFSSLKAFTPNLYPFKIHTEEM